jgi:cell wall-associated NlpC family hydrolase
MTITAKDVLAVATPFADKKYKEGPNNTSIFGEWYGHNQTAWCAMFVSYCFAKAGAGALVAGAQTKKGFHSCSHAVKHYSHMKQLVPVEAVQPGDIVFMNFRGTDEPDHVGIAISHNRLTKRVKCVEGNTVNPDGTGDQKNGDGCYYKQRPYKNIVAVVRPSWKLVADKSVKSTVKAV